VFIEHIPRANVYGIECYNYSSSADSAVHLKRSKNDPFAAGMTLHLGAAGEALCPVSSMLGYLAINPTTSGPLFLFHDGSLLSRPRLVKSLHQVLSAARVDYSGYSCSGHSFWIGVTTTAARMGVSDSLIKTLGCSLTSALEPYRMGLTLVLAICSHISHHNI